MELTIYIIAGIVIQIIISSFHRIGGALFSFIVTTFILIYGLELYDSRKGAIAFFGMELSQWSFNAFIFIWYSYDIRALFDAIKTNSELKKEIHSTENVE